MANMQKHLKELNNTAEFLRNELEKAREKLVDAPLTVTYDHGGGQSGERENPALTAYAKMIKSYQSVLTQIEKADDSQGSAKVVPMAGVSRWKKQA